MYTYIYIYIYIYIYRTYSCSINKKKSTNVVRPTFSAEYHKRHNHEFPVVRGEVPNYGTPHVKK